MYKKITKDMLKFIQDSPTSYQAVSNMASILEENRYIRLYENKPFAITPGNNYYITKNDSSIIAFCIPENTAHLGFNITASHCDSPTFKIKEQAEVITAKHYTRLNTEGYGGMIMSTWFDRPLSVAGRVMVKEKNRVVSKLLNIDKNLLLIPNVAIHMDRSINDGYKYNPQVDLLPLFAGSDKEGAFKGLIAKTLKVSEGQIMGSDLYLYNRQAPAIWGKDKEFISSGRLDNLENAYCSLLALIDSKPADSTVNVMVCFNNEEVGSASMNGAASTFLSDTLERIGLSLGLSREEYLCALSDSFMLSADNGHGVHPNHPEHTDSTNTTYLNEGVVLKYQASLRYTTDGTSAALVRALAAESKVPVQTFANRSDKPGGSTLGNISLGQVSIHCADIGLAMLAMHSAYETAGSMDSAHMYNLLKTFYGVHLKAVEDGIEIL